MGLFPPRPPGFLNKVENAPFTITALHCLVTSPLFMWLVVKATLQSKGCCSGAYRCPQNSRANTCLLTLPHHIKLCTSDRVHILNNTDKKSQIQRFVFGWLYFWQAVPIFPFCWLLVAHIYAHLIAIAILEQVILYGCTMTKIGVKVPVQLALQRQPCC